MLSSDDDESDMYPLYSDPALLDGTLSLSAAADTGIASDSFDSTAFLANSISDDIANYNFLEPLMPIYILDDSGNNETESNMSSTQADTVCSGSYRTSYTFDPVSLSIVRCVVSSTTEPTSKPPTSTANQSAHHSAENTAHNQSHLLNAACDEELDTQEITRRVSEELRRCNISQALFAQAVLGRSQGTLSDLLRKPKPWAQLKSGRETFAKMRQWLMEPEQQRLAYLSVTGSQQTARFCSPELESSVQALYH